MDVEKNSASNMVALLTQRHNEVQDALGDLTAIVYKDVVREPIVQEADDSSGRPALIADLSIRGVWQPQTAALLDVRAVDTDAQSLIALLMLCYVQQNRKRKESTQQLLKKDVLHLNFL